MTKCNEKTTVSRPSTSYSSLVNLPLISDRLSTSGKRNPSENVEPRYSKPSPQNSISDHGHISVDKTLKVDENSPQSRDKEIEKCFGFEDSGDEIEDVESVYSPCSLTQNLCGISPVRGAGTTSTKDKVEGYLNSTRASVHSPAYTKYPILQLEETKIISGNINPTKLASSKTSRFVFKKPMQIDNTHSLQSNPFKASSSSRPSPTSNSTSLKRGSTNANQPKTKDCNNMNEIMVQKVDSVQHKKVASQIDHVPKNLNNGISNHHLGKSPSSRCNKKPDSLNHQYEGIENSYPITKDISESCQLPNVLNEPGLAETELAADLGRKNVFNVLKNTTNTNFQSCKANKENGKKIDTFDHPSKSKKQTLIYETVGELKQLKSAPKVKENLGRYDHQISNYMTFIVYLIFFLVLSIKHNNIYFFITA